MIKLGMLPDNAEASPKDRQPWDDVDGGELIGLDSGDQFSLELYNQNKHKAHKGRLLLAIRPKGKGTISFQCRAGDLKSVSINIQNYTNTKI